MLGFASVPQEGLAALRCQSQGTVGELIWPTSGPVTTWC